MNNPFTVFSQLKDADLQVERLSMALKNSQNEARETSRLRSNLEQAQRAISVVTLALTAMTVRAQKAEVALDAAMQSADPVAWRSRSAKGSVWHPHIERPEPSAKTAVIEALYTHPLTKESL